MPPRKPVPLDRAERAALRLLRDLIREQQHPRATIKPVHPKPTTKGRE